LHSALRTAMRQAPDVLFIGEIRDRETMGAALAYSMSGHLVVATMHATNSAHALNRVISFYTPETRQALFQDLAASLKAIISQRLVRSKKGGRVPTVEVLMNSGHMSDLVERGDVQSIKEAMEQSLAPESQTFEQSLYTLLQKDAVTREDALGSADSKNNLLWLINNAGKPSTQAAQAGRKDQPVAPASSFSEFTLNI
jgi:twitching motility protein PilU